MKAKKKGAGELCLEKKVKMQKIINGYATNVEKLVMIKTLKFKLELLKKSRLNYLWKLKKIILKKLLIFKKSIKMLFKRCTKILLEYFLTLITL
jgi:hypothetical protein